jgi:hypothetical protein
MTDGWHGNDSKSKDKDAGLEDVISSPFIRRHVVRKQKKNLKAHNLQLFREKGAGNSVAGGSGTIAAIGADELFPDMRSLIKHKSTSFSQISPMRTSNKTLLNASVTAGPSELLKFFAVSKDIEMNEVRPLCLAVEFLSHTYAVHGIARGREIKQEKVKERRAAERAEAGIWRFITGDAETTRENDKAAPQQFYGCKSLYLYHVIHFVKSCWFFSSHIISFELFDSPQLYHSHRFLMRLLPLDLLALQVHKRKKFKKRVCL